MLLHEKLKQIRENKGLLQKDSAEHLGINENFVSMIESGQRLPSWKNLNKLLKLYNVDKKLELEILKEFVELRLSDDLFEATQRIQEIVKNEMTRDEIESEVASRRDKDGDFEIYKDAGLTSVITFLKEMEPERREKALNIFLRTSKLPLNKFLYFSKLFDLLIEHFDENQLEQILGMANIMNK